MARRRRPSFGRRVFPVRELRGPQWSARAHGASNGASTTNYYHKPYGIGPPWPCGDYYHAARIALESTARELTTEARACWRVAVAAA
mmetsp:Transcript_96537/g.275388  ORF Transcript_96537/g.275388 Transcript_96537/m.275388 type:complete len:87 (-) Transcript_96537:222-482(-)